MAAAGSLKKWLAWGFWGLNLAIIVAFWISGEARAELASGDAAVMLRAIARLLGLLATFCALTQFVLMGRLGWLEPIFGLDRLAVFHRRNGVAAISLILLHSSLMVATQGLLNGDGLFGGLPATLGLPYVWLAVIAETLLILTVGLSIYIVRKHLKFETWYAVHLFNYAAIAIVPFHQFVNGTDFLLNPLFATYWLALYIFVALNVIVWRFGMPFWKYFKHRFRVEKVVKETPTATSVYITGRVMDRFRAKGGQFVLVRFLTKDLVWQEHPFSLSALPNGQHIRLTIRQLGDFTNMMPNLKPGTGVAVSGPFGTFTHQKQMTDKVLYIAGGIGITPIRAMIEERAQAGKSDAVMLYGNRSLADTALMGELQPLAEKIGMPIYNVLSDQPDYTGEKGFVDKEKIARLVPDVATRDIFLCGPPPMMWGIIAGLKELGVPPAQIHYERFSLHKD